MKLTKSKVGIYPAVLILALALLVSLGSVVSAEVHNVDDISDLGGNLSEITGYSDGDTINLTFDTQTQSVNADSSPIIVDLENITINGQGATINVDASGNDYTPAKYSGSSIVIKESGAKIQNLAFDPINGLAENAIEVDMAGACSCTQPELELYNLTIASQSCASAGTGSFEDGILFTNSGSADLDYKHVQFDEISTGCGVERHGIYFLDGDVSDGGSNSGGLIVDVYSVDFTNMDLKSCGQDNKNGAGIKFANTGALKDISIKDSEGDDYGIEDNDHGIVIQGATSSSSGVTRIENFEVKNVDIKSNNEQGFWIQGDSAMQTIDKFYLESSTIVENGKEVSGGYGVFVDNVGAKLSEIEFTDLVVRDNYSGGAYIATSGSLGEISSTAPYGLKITDSRFNDSNPTQTQNDQRLGLYVEAEGGLRHVKIDNSTFHNHKAVTDNSASNGFGVGLFGGSSGEVQDIAIHDSAASYNATFGLGLEGNSVADVSIKVTEDSEGQYGFKENGAFGIGIEGNIGVDNVTFVDEDGDDSKDLVVDENGGNLGSDDSISLLNSSDNSSDWLEELKSGAFIYNANGNIGNVSVTSATFDENEGEGIELKTKSSGDIKEVSFSDVTANGNKGGSGLAIKSSENISNSNGNVLVDPSQFNNNNNHGVTLEAKDSIIDPIFKDSEFKKNDADDNFTGAGINIEAGESPGDEILGVRIENNTITDNFHGISVRGNKLKDLKINNNEKISGNGPRDVDTSDDYESPRNISLTGNKLEDLSVVDNREINDVKDDEYGLYLEVGTEGTSSNITVARNKFASGIEALCGGSGTAIMLNARNVDVNHNEFVRFDPTIVVKQESSGTIDKPEDTSNHINDNNFEGCCTTIDVRLDGGQKVDATNNYWGEATSLGDVKDTLAGNTDQIFLESLRDEPVEVGDEDVDITVSITPTEPGVNETIEIEYVLENTTGSSMTLDSVRLTVTGPDDEAMVDNEEVQSDLTIDSGSSKSFTYEFTTGNTGDYEATINADDEYSGSLTFPVGEIEPEDKEPYWGTDSEPSKSGVLPAPVDGSETPFLELANKDGNDVASYVTINSMKVFDLTGAKVLEVKDGFDDLSALENLENGLYLYIVELEESSSSSSVMKLVVKN